MTGKSVRAKKIGAVVLAYCFGILVGNSGLLPRPSEALTEFLAGEKGVKNELILPLIEQGVFSGNDLAANQILNVQDSLMSVTVLLAIPLLLFSLNLRNSIKQAKKAIFSLFLGLSSLLIVIFTGYFIFQNQITDAWKIAGMLVGIYTGGTPNLAAISSALDVAPNTFILVNTYDIIIGAVVLMFILTLSQNIFNRFLPLYKKSSITNQNKNSIEDKEIDNYRGMFSAEGLKNILKALLTSVVILIIAALSSLLVNTEATQTVIVILTVTTLGIAGSLIKPIHRIDKSFQLGMYFIVVFSLVLSSMSDLQSMFHIQYLYLFLYVILAVIGSMAVHVFLSWLFKVDSDTTIITITALTYSAPFVPVVAGALKNKEVIITGITTGIIGYAFGNYLGIGLAYFLK